MFITFLGPWSNVDITYDRQYDVETTLQWHCDVILMLLLCYERCSLTYSRHVIYIEKDPQIDIDYSSTFSHQIVITTSGWRFK